MKIKLILFCLLFLILFVGSAQAQSSVYYNGRISFYNPVTDAFTVHMLPGDTLDVYVISEDPVNIYSTDQNTFTNYILSGKWQPQWPYDASGTALNVKSKDIHVQATQEWDYNMIINDASGHSNNFADVKIIRNSSYTDAYHNQIATAKQNAYIDHLNRYGDEWAKSFSYGICFTLLK